MPTQTLVASGGTGPYTYAVTTGSLPAGNLAERFNGSSHRHGHPGWQHRLHGHRNGRQHQHRHPGLHLDGDAPTITLTPPAGNIAVNSETAFTQTFTATGGTAPYTYVEAGTLPTGLTWTAGTATIAGTATQSGSFPITITATDHSTGTGSPYSSGAIAYTLVVAGPTITMTPAASPLTATVATAFTQAFVASGAASVPTPTLNPEPSRPASPSPGTPFPEPDPGRHLRRHHHHREGCRRLHPRADVHADGECAHHYAGSAGG